LGCCRGGPSYSRNTGGAARTVAASVTLTGGAIFTALRPEVGQCAFDVALADARSPVMGSENAAEGRGQPGKVAVVDTAIVQLVSELGEQPRSVPPGGRGRHANLHLSFDHMDRGSPGRRGPCLFPRSVPAGGRAPLGDRATPPGRDRPTAPGAGRRHAPPVVRLSRFFAVLRAPCLFCARPTRSRRCRSRSRRRTR
jgi:hypothetical protein